MVSINRVVSGLFALLLAAACGTTDNGASNDGTMRLTDECWALGIHDGVACNVPGQFCSQEGIACSVSGCARCECDGTTMSWKCAACATPAGVSCDAGGAPSPPPGDAASDAPDDASDDAPDGD
jgi:hypothetical protein